MHIAEAEAKAVFAAQEREERRITGQILARGKPAARRKERWEASREAQRILDGKQAAISDEQRAQCASSA